MRNARIIGAVGLHRQLVALLACVALAACQVVLGFEDHGLGAPDSGAAQPAGNGGTSSGVAATHVGIFSGGNSTGGTPASVPTPVLTGGTSTGGDSAALQTLVLIGGTSTGGDSAALQTLVLTGGTSTGGDSAALQTLVLTGGTSTGTSVSTAHLSQGGTTSELHTFAGGASAAAGSGTTVSDAGADASCEACSIKTTLVHRYSFNGLGARAVDSVGIAHGKVIGTELSGRGTVVLNGSDQYVTLPSGLISRLTNATFEAWLTWQGGAAWQRVFDFGNSSGDAGITYLFLTATDGKAGHPRAAYSTSGLSAETRLLSPESLPTGVVAQIALTISATSERFSMFINGVQTASGPFDGSLDQINDLDNWLGRSQFSADPNISGVFDEFRIYEAALTPAQVKLSYELGPDTTFE